ncbi:hypothetical protein RKD37_003738 [Streptomyces ambofaciens]
MRAVVAAVRRHHPAQLGQLGVLGVHAGRVRQPRRHADRALLHALGDQAPHVLQLRLSGLPVVPADGEGAHRALRDQVGRVDRDAPVQPVQVLADRPPVEVDVVARAVPPGDRAAHLAEGAVVDRRVRQPVLADDLQGDALRGLGAVVGVPQQCQVAVGVHVDEAGGEDQALGVQLAACLGALAAGGRRLLDDRDDPAAVDHDVGAVGVGAGAVHDVGVPDDQLFHVPLPQKNVRM